MSMNDNHLPSVTHVSGLIALAERLDAIVDCFDEGGEYRAYSAPLGTQQIREEAKEICEELRALAAGRRPESGW